MAYIDVLFFLKLSIYFILFYFYNIVVVFVTHWHDGAPYQTANRPPVSNQRGPATLISRLGPPAGGCPGRRTPRRRRAPGPGRAGVLCASGDPASRPPRLTWPGKAASESRRRSRRRRRSRSRRRRSRSRRRRRSLGGSARSTSGSLGTSETPVRKAGLAPA